MQSMLSDSFRGLDSKSIPHQWRFLDNDINENGTDQKRDWDSRDETSEQLQKRRFISTRNTKEDRHEQLSDALMI